MTPRSQHAKATVPWLRFFGAVELLAPTGEPLSPLLAQIKPLALLAYLLVAEPRGYRRRDHLLGLFWPDLDEGHARTAVRKTLHLLRSTLGHAAVLTRGDDDVAIASDALWCDVVAFDAAIDAGQTMRALELYRGDFLSGYILRGGGDFHLWLESTRTRYQKQAATAAWIVAERAEDEESVTIATEWARRAVVLSPSDERVVRKALALLARVGDRAGAMALYDGFRARLAQEYDTEPAPETVMLMRQIRERRA